MDTYPSYPSLPKLQIKGTSLFLQSPPLQDVLNLYAYRQIVHFSSANKQVEIRIKKWWCWQQPKRFRYSQIDCIDLTCDKISEFQAENIIHVYKLLLITHNPFQRTILAKFGGSLRQNEIFRKAAGICAETVSKYTGIRFGMINEEVPLGGFQDKYVCKNCGHKLHPDSEVIVCRYCGGKEIDIVAESG